MLLVSKLKDKESPDRAILFGFEVGFVNGIAPYEGNGLVSTKLWLVSFVKKRRKICIYVLKIKLLIYNK